MGALLPEVSSIACSSDSFFQFRYSITLAHNEQIRCSSTGPKPCAVGCGLEFRVGFRVQAIKFRVQGSESRV